MHPPRLIFSFPYVTIKPHPKKTKTQNYRKRRRSLNLRQQKFGETEAGVRHVCVEDYMLTVEYQSSSSSSRRLSVFLEADCPRGSVSRQSRPIRIHYLWESQEESVHSPLLWSVVLPMCANVTVLSPSARKIPRGIKVRFISVILHHKQSDCLP